MISLKKIGAGALTLLFMAGSAAVYAQVPQQQQQQQVPQLNQQQNQKTDVSDKDLKKFAKAYPKVQKENQKAQEEMVGVIQDNGMELKRFNEIQTAEMQNKKSDATKDEEQKLSKIKDSLDKLQPKLQQKIQSAATSTGLSVDKFQKIAMAIQSDQNLQAKFQKTLADLSK